MCPRRIVLLLALALVAPLLSFALGRDLTPVRIVTPDYSLDSIAAATTQNGFLLLWSSQTHGYGLTADAAGAPRIVTAEYNTTWLIDRARFYLASELLLPRRHAAH
jgi:hypothetical protein